MRIRERQSGQGGFTLIEVLVTLTLIAAIVAIIAPTLFSQLDQGDATQLRGDLQNVANGIKTFRVDVSPEFPGDMEDLVNQIEASGGSSDQSLSASNYNSGQVNRWNGPYLEIEANSSSSATFSSGFGGDVQDEFLDGDNDAYTNNSNDDGWVVIQVNNLTSNALTTLDEEFDDAASSTGRFRHDASSTLYYLAVQK